jgi:hypothetical protein
MNMWVKASGAVGVILLLTVIFLPAEGLRSGGSWQMFLCCMIFALLCTVVIDKTC